MDCEREIAFFCRLMQKYNIQTLRYNPSEVEKLDLGLRHNVGMVLDDATLREMKDNTVYFVQDVFLCRYILLKLPGKPEALAVGPYLMRDVNECDIMGILEKNDLPMELLPILKQQYRTVMHITSNDAAFLGLINTLGEGIWGDMDAFQVEYVESGKLGEYIRAADHELIEKSVDMANFEIMEARYEGERKLMHAVSHGLLHQAQMIMSHITDAALEQRAADPLRNAKNYGIVCNTLLRKAVEAGGVHPLHIDRLSDSLARQLEKLHTVDEVLGMYNKMVHKYCLLVKNHSMQGYSQLVQRVILRVETDLTADLSLAAHAEQLNVNASYLSTLFKKEMGVTLTEYVNRQRVEHGIFLLNATDLLIQTIAQYCGMPDVNYFTKTFKKVTGKTPSEYRNQVIRRPNS